MEHKVFTTKSLKTPPFFQKMLGIKFKPNAIIELNNLLADKDLRRINLEDIQKISESYKIDFKEDFSLELIATYKEYLLKSLEDKFLSDQEIEDLKYLKFLLGLNDFEVEEAHKEMAGFMYQQALELVVKNGEIDENERQFIEKLQKDLRLPSELADRILRSSGKEILSDIIDDAISDARLSAVEEEELTNISKNLNLELPEDATTKALLEKAKLLYQIENDQIPELEVDISIPKREKVYFTCKVKWYEEIKVSEQHTFSLSNLKLKINKGEYWRHPSKSPLSLDAKNWEYLDEGDLFLTNKRILFKTPDPRKTDKVTLLSRVIDFDVFSNGIGIDKEVGNKDVFLEFDNNPDLFAMLLGKAIIHL